MGPTSESVRSRELNGPRKPHVNELSKSAIENAGVLADRLAPPPILGPA